MFYYENLLQFIDLLYLGCFHLLLTVTIFELFDTYEGIYSVESPGVASLQGWLHMLFTAKSSSLGDLFCHSAFPQVIYKNTYTFSFRFWDLCLKQSASQRTKTLLFFVISGSKDVIIILKSNIYIMGRVFFIKLLWIWKYDSLARLWSAASNPLVSSSGWEHGEKTQLIQHAW